MTIDPLPTRIFTKYNTFSNFLKLFFIISKWYLLSVAKFSFVSYFFCLVSIIYSH